VCGSVNRNFPQEVESGPNVANSLSSLFAVAVPDIQSAMYCTPTTTAWCQPAIGFALTVTMVTGALRQDFSMNLSARRRNLPTAAVRNYFCEKTPASHLKAYLEGSRNHCLIIIPSQTRTNGHCDVPQHFLSLTLMSLNQSELAQDAATGVLWPQAK